MTRLVARRRLFTPNVHPMVQPEGTPERPAFMIIGIEDAWTPGRFDRINAGKCVQRGAVIRYGNLLLRLPHARHSAECDASGASSPASPRRNRGEHLDGGLFPTPLRGPRVADARHARISSRRVERPRPVPRTLASCDRHKQSVPADAASSDQFKKEQKLRNALATFLEAAGHETVKGRPRVRASQSRDERRSYKSFSHLPRTITKENNKGLEFPREAWKSIGPLVTATPSAPCAIRRSSSGPPPPTASPRSISPRRRGSSPQHVSREPEKSQVPWRGFTMRSPTAHSGVGIRVTSRRLNYSWLGS